MSNLAKRGIVLIAVGHPYYGRMAFNLAMTIKSVDKDFPIAVVHSHNSLSHLWGRQLSFFDEKIPLPSNIPNGFGGKLYLDELSPFEESVFTDADMAWMPNRKPEELFNEVSSCDYTGITEGYFDIETESKENASNKYYFWADPLEIKEKYKLTSGKLYQWRSEVIYFKKTERILDFFKTCREIYTNPNLSTIKMFGQQIPDELPINISAAIHGIEPHQYKWLPALWPRLHGADTSPFGEMYSKYYLLSCGSNYSTPDVRKLYDRMVKSAAWSLKMEHVFPMANKRDFIPERQKM